MSKPKQDPVALARKLLEALGQPADAPANDEIDEDALQEKARGMIERAIRARKR